MARSAYSLSDVGAAKGKHPLQLGIRPDLDDATGLPLGIGVDVARAALQTHPEARAVLLTDPSYVGTCADLPTIAEVTRAAGVPARRRRGLGRALRQPPRPAAVATGGGGRTPW